MTIASFPIAEFIGILVGFFLTLCVFSYIFGDNALFRLAVHIFIGVTSAYLIIIIWTNVLWPKVLMPIVSSNTRSTNPLVNLIPLILCLLLLTKLFPRISSVGSPIMAFLVGVGVAIAIGGALIGTLIPQVLATINLFDFQVASQSDNVYWIIFLESFFILIGTLSTLIYFHFGARASNNKSPNRSSIIEAIASVGKFFIAITFGVLVANVLIASLSTLASQWYQITSFFLSLIKS